MKRYTNFGKSLLLASTCVALLYSVPAQAEPLSDLLPGLLDSHERIKAAQDDLAAAEAGVDRAFGDYLPSVTAKASGGHEDQLKPDSADTSTGFSDVSLSATQLIYDFGKTGAQVNRARLGQTRSALALKEAENGLVFEAISAYMGLIKAARTRGYALQTEANIKKYTGLEESRVERGRGLRSDVLQAKRNLADATATRIGADGALQNAMNRFKTVFRHDVGDLKTFARPQVPYDLLPADVDQAVAIALDNNAGLKMAQIAYDVSLQTAAADRASLYAPKISANADLKRKSNASGTIGTKIERLVKVELSFPLYSGGKDLAAYNGSLRSSDAAKNRHDDQRYSVEETVRRAWQSLQTARATVGYRRNSANISAEFLSLANREREMGKRSLLDIMSSENAYFNSMSAAETADVDMALAVYELLYAMGQLDISVVKETAAGETNPTDMPAKG